MLPVHRDAQGSLQGKGSIVVRIDLAVTDPAPLQTEVYHEFFQALGNAPAAISRQYLQQTGGAIIMEPYKACKHAFHSGGKQLSGLRPLPNIICSPMIDLSG